MTTEAPLLSILVPYRPGDEHHDRNWAWTSSRWRALLPDAELLVEADDGGGSPEEFNHPRALNRAAARATGALFLIVDIDIVPDPGWVTRAIEQVRNGAPWVVAERYLKLGLEATDHLLACDPHITIHSTSEVEEAPWFLEEAPILSSCAPPLVITREGFDKAGGYDERIAWWGADDGVFRICADTFWAPMERCPGDALHLWHPRPAFHHPHQGEQQQLVHRYLDAAGDQDAVRAIRYEGAPA